MFYPIYKAFKGQKQKKEPKPCHNVGRLHIISSDWQNRMQMDEILSVQSQFDATFSILAGLFFVNLHQ